MRRSIQKLYKMQENLFHWIVIGWIAYSSFVVCVLSQVSYPNRALPSQFGSTMQVHEFLISHVIMLRKFVKCV